MEDEEKRRPFTASRPDGRSDKVVIYDNTKDAEPETLFEDKQVIAWMADGLEGEFITKGRVYSAVTAANKLLLKDCRRYLMRVKNYGYTMARASDHMPVAIHQKRRAENCLERGLEVLRGCRLNELKAPERQVHEGTLMMVAGLVQMMKHAEKRAEEHEKVLSDLQVRVGQLEGKV